MVSWTLYSFSMIFGLAAIGLLWFLDCDGVNPKTTIEYDASRKSAKKWIIPLLTIILTLSNIVGMILCKPDLPVSQKFVPHFANVILLISSVFLGLSICNK